MTEPSASPSLDIIVEQFTDELNSGGRPSVEEYVSRYPEYGDDLQDLLNSVYAIHAEPQASILAEASDSHHLRAGREFGEYNIVREIGFGGMGTVYEAVHRPLKRRVALKVMNPRMVNETNRGRFELEARAAASLHHTHIVPVFEAGDFHGLQYIALQFIDGISLETLTSAKHDEIGTSKVRQFGDSTIPSLSNSVVDDVGDTSTALLTEADDAHRYDEEQIKKSRLHDQELWRIEDRFRFSADVAQQIADAIAYAHTHGVLHRDIKPSNVLLDKEGAAWVTDFGLAKTEDQNLTYTGELVGTLRYMAPERFDGQCDARSEVYSIGLLLYELVCGGSPFGDGTRAEIVKRITSGQLTPIRRVCVDVPVDLETIIDKATQRLPGDRYQTAGELAEDLSRFNSGLPIVGGKLTQAQRCVRWCRRNPAVASLLTALALSVAVGALMFGNQYAATLRANRKLTEQNAELENSYLAEQAAKTTAQQNLRANANTVEFFMRLFRSPDPAREGRTVTLASQLLNAFVELKEDKQMPWETRTSLLQAVGVSLGSLGLVPESVESLQLSDSLQAEYLPQDSRRRLVTRAHLGNSLMAAGQMEDALKVLRQTVTDSTTVFGEFDKQTRSAANLLADALRITGDPEAAILLLEPIMRWEDENLEGPSEESATTLNNLALALQANREIERAIKLTQKCVQQEELLYGEDDPRTLMASNNLANMYGQSGQIDEAKQLIDHIFETRVRVLGPNHPATLNSQNALAGIYMSTGDVPKALSILEDVVTRLQGKLGDDHHQTLGTRFNLGVLQLKTGDFQAAKETFAACSKLMSQVWTPNHPTVVKCKRYHARCVSELGETTRAIEELTQLLEALNASGADEATIASVQQELDKIAGAAN